MSGIGDYLDDLVARLREALGDRLVGAWLFGSAALGGFDPERSDLDVQAVSTLRVAEDELRALAASLAALPCPARGLEFVLYARDEIPRFQLNLNTGPRMRERLDLEPADEERFWFTIDIAVGREHGRTLAGPPAHDVFPQPERHTVVAALDDAVTWLHDHGDDAGAALAARRAAAWIEDGRWVSKAEAGRR